MNNPSGKKQVFVYFKDEEKAILRATKEEAEQAVSNFKGGKSTIEIGESIFKTSEIKAIIVREIHRASGSNPVHAF